MFEESHLGHLRWLLLLPSEHEFERLLEWFFERGGASAAAPTPFPGTAVAEEGGAQGEGKLGRRGGLGVPSRIIPPFKGRMFLSPPIKVGVPNSS